MLDEALAFWSGEPDGTRLKPHLRSAVIQSFEFSYELSLRLLRRVLMERSGSPPQAQVVAECAADFAADARTLLEALETSLGN